MLKVNIVIRIEDGVLQAYSSNYSDVQLHVVDVDEDSDDKVIISGPLEPDVLHKKVENAIDYFSHD